MVSLAGGSLLSLPWERIILFLPVGRHFASLPGDGQSYVILDG